MINNISELAKLLRFGKPFLLDIGRTLPYIQNKPNHSWFADDISERIKRKNSYLYIWSREYL